MKLTRVLIVAVVGLTMLFTACENPYDPDGNGGLNPDSIPQGCRVMATVVSMPYGNSIYGKLWFKTTDGKLFLPCQQSAMTCNTMELHEGDKIKFGYRKLSAEQDCLKDAPELKVMDAIPFDYQAVMIDCIQLVKRCGTEPSPCSYLLIDNNTYEDHMIQVLESTIIGNELKLKVGYSGCAPWPDSYFKLVWNGFLQESYPAQAELHFAVHSSNQNVCQAYFTNELCFDLSAIKKVTKEPVLLHIGATTIKYQ